MPPHLNPLPRRGEEIIKIPLSLEGEGRGEGEMEANPAAHSVKEDCNQLVLPLIFPGTTPSIEFAINYPVFFYNPKSSAIPCIAVMLKATKSSKGIPMGSHSRIMSRFTFSAKRFSFIRLVTDFTFTLAIFFSG